LTIRAGGQGARTPCHHNLEQDLDEDIAAAGIAGDPDGPLFRTTGRKTGKHQPIWQQDAYRMIQRRAKAAGMAEPPPRDGAPNSPLSRKRLSTPAATGPSTLRSIR
jgi:hypothetical protein